ncbi:hypothetical protein IQ269_02690 [Tychonema sp. LEGE 07199]|uniref:hypothetical protein n=1 Tax=unclassified Tychonema TaxID=2642144 RepID=UPI00187F2C73|nr:MULTISPECIES: hypothetical protein [unclassified Tychonema]MBE9119738.1 hypothetical protein [Tychonema sp. LEGE 07199]MBE9131629.1 hypothetical protein [Tychonema sp. LEGE 07196]
MDLDQQIEALIDKAPPDGSTPQILKAIAPALILIAQQLQHLEYSILQAVDESWAIVVLSNLKQPGREKKVIYAFPTLEDASSAAAAGGDRVRPVCLPVTHILFQMIALEGLDSIVFFENPGNQEVGTEIPRPQVQELISVYLQQYRSALQSNSSNLPPDIA